MVHMLKDCLPLQDIALQTPLHAAATKLITGALSDYYTEFLVTMVTKAREIPEKTAEILNARDQHGNTVLHYLAQSEIALVAIHSIIAAGGDTTISNKKKLTPLDIAMNYGIPSVIKALNAAVRRSNRCDKSGFDADSPPESPVNLGNDDKGENDSLMDHSAYTKNSVDPPNLVCSEDSSFNSSAELEAVDVPVNDAVSGTTDDISAPPCTAGAAASVMTTDVLPPGTNDETPPAACNELPGDGQDNATSEVADDALSVDSDQPPSRDSVETSAQRECGCTGIGVQTPMLNPYSCIVHIKQEMLSPVSVLCFTCTCVWGTENHNVSSMGVYSRTPLT